MTCLVEKRGLLSRHGLDEPKSLTNLLHPKSENDMMNKHENPEIRRDNETGGGVVRQIFQGLSLENLPSDCWRIEWSWHQIRARLPVVVGHCASCYRNVLTCDDLGTAQTRSQFVVGRPISTTLPESEWILMDDLTPRIVSGSLYEQAQEKLSTTGRRRHRKLRTSMRSSKTRFASSGYAFDGSDRPCNRMKPADKLPDNILRINFKQPHKTQRNENVLRKTSGGAQSYERLRTRGRVLRATPNRRWLGVARRSLGCNVPVMTVVLDQDSGADRSDQARSL